MSLKKICLIKFRIILLVGSTSVFLRTKKTKAIDFWYLSLIYCKKLGRRKTLMQKAIVCLVFCN